MVLLLSAVQGSITATKPQGNRHNKLTSSMSPSWSDSSLRSCSFIVRDGSLRLMIFFWCLCALVIPPQKLEQQQVFVLGAEILYHYIRLDVLVGNPLAPWPTGRNEGRSRRPKAHQLTVEVDGSANPELTLYRYPTLTCGLQDP